MRIDHLTINELKKLLTGALAVIDDVLIDAIYDELERRERAMENFDWDEQDRRAAAEERYELWRREY